MEFLVIPGRIQMERFIPVECFRKKGNLHLSRYSLFLALTGIPGNFCTICSQLQVPEKIDRFICFPTGTTCFSDKWYNTFPFPFSKYRTCTTICRKILSHRKFHSNGKRSIFPPPRMIGKGSFSRLWIS